MKYIVTLLLILVILTGCSDDSNLTPKQMVTKNLMYELKYCDKKFGDSSYTEYRLLNEKYCNKMFSITNKLINEGWFDEDYRGDVVEVFKEVEKEVAEYNNTNFDINDGSIIGDI